MDLFPTFCELGGGIIPDAVEGKSLLPILQGKASEVRKVLYTGYRECQRAIRDERWKLIRYPLVDKTQLFDLQADPHELTNLAGLPEQAAKVADLTKLLQHEMAQYADKVPLKVASPMPAAWVAPAKAGKPGKKQATAK